MYRVLRAFIIPSTNTRPEVRRFVAVCVHLLKTAYLVDSYEKLSLYVRIVIFCSTIHYNLFTFPSMQYNFVCQR